MDPQNGELENDADRRQYLRIKRNIRIACRRFSDQDIKRSLDFTEDISPEGILLESDLDAAVNSIVEITLFTRDQKMKALGEVVRKTRAADKWQIAVKFIRIDHESREYIKQLVSQGDIESASTDQSEQI